MKDIFKKLRRYEIRIRKALNAQMQGDFHSIFKGSGLEFDDVRPYQWGDDVRNIDWKVSAKGHGTFMKTFIEEKEQTVMFLLDVSASQQIGKKKKQKIDISNEITGLLTLAAIKEGSKVGFLAYSDRVESYIKPQKSLKHAYEILNNIFSLQPVSKQTNLDGCIKHTLNIINRKTIIFFVSDFIDEDYTHSMRGLARKHDLVAIHVKDRSESQMTQLGIVPLLEKESGKTIWMNTSSDSYKQIYEKSHGSQQNNLEKFCKSNDINYVSIGTEEEYVPKLVKLFRYRNRSNARKKR